MSEGRTLLVGFDICDDYSQMSCYHPKKESIEPVYIQNDNPLIPTALAVKYDTKEFKFAYEALQCAKAEEGILIEHLIDHTRSNENILIYGVEFTPEALWIKFFKKALSLLKRTYPNDSIRQLVITLSNPDKSIKAIIYKALSSLGIQKDRAVIKDHKEAYLYYALNQKREIWMNDVGLFELNDNGLTYSQIKINRRALPMIVETDDKYLDEFSLAEITEEKEGYAYRFQSLAKSVMHKQIISTLFITGKGFEGDWADNIIKELCIGRKVFKGQNLYTQGACYIAKSLIGEGTLEDFIYLNEDRIGYDVTMKVYSDAKQKEITLVKAGTMWDEADGNIQVIPDKENEIQIFIKNIIKKEELSCKIILDGMIERPPRTTRLSVNISFKDNKTLCCAIKDMGFGDFYPSTNRIWEERISL